MHLATLAEQQPDKAAYIMAATDQVFTFKDLEEGSNQLAHLFRAAGLKRGDHIAILLENHPSSPSILALRPGATIVFIRV